MTTPPLLLLADRGCLKAFHVNRKAPHRPAARLIDSWSFEEAHGDFSDRYSDQAGSFPEGGTGGQGNAHAERMTLDAERETRIFRQIATRLTAFLEEHEPARWGFAAPAEINGAILDGLDERWKERLTVNLTRDLINHPAQEMLEIFAKTQER